MPSNVISCLKLELPIISISLSGCVAKWGEHSGTGAGEEFFTIYSPLFSYALPIVLFHSLI